MDIKKEFEMGQQLTRDKQFELAINHYKVMLETYENDPKVYYWALKHYADVIGFLYYKDYFSAIDMYQKIINEYEEEDGLYELSQTDMAKTYLNFGMQMMENCENMIDMLNPYDENMREYIDKIIETREDFITVRAEAIYKTRM